jgi:hypothetical protein
MSVQCTGRELSGEPHCGACSSLTPGLFLCSWDTRQGPSALWNLGLCLHLRLSFLQDKGYWRQN